MPIDTEDDELEQDEEDKKPPVDDDEDEQKPPKSVTGASLEPAAPARSITGMGADGKPVLPPATLVSSGLAGGSPNPPQSVTSLSSPGGVARPQLDRLNALEASGPGIGHRHGLTGGLLKTLETIGTIVSPGAMRAIPGTRLNYGAQLNAGRQAANEEASQIGAQDQERLRGAQTEEAEATSDQRRALAQKARTPVAPKAPTNAFELWAQQNPDAKVSEYFAEQAGTKSPSLGASVPNINKAFTDRYQVLNPGKPLPEEFTLPDNATKADYDRVDKGLEQVEKAQGTKAQQDTTNEIRKQTQSLANEASADRKQKQTEGEEEKGRKMVVGTDSTGREVMVPASQAKDLKLKDPYDAPAADVSKAIAARHFLPLVSNANKDNPGILQMIDKLDADGKLGTIASRWNDFMAGKVGAGDPDFERLRVAMGLSNTLLMNLHVGNRGGSYMLEHFEDLANAGKMDAATLKAGVDQELKYARSRAMSPASAAAAQHKPGDTVNYQGKPRTVKTVRADGSLELN